MPYPEPIIELGVSSWEQAINSLPKTGGGTVVVKYSDQPIVVPSNSRHNWAKDGDYLVVGELGPNGERPHITTDPSDPCGTAIGLGRFGGKLEVRNLEFSNFKTIFGVGHNRAERPQHVIFSNVHAHHAQVRVLMGSNDVHPNWWTKIELHDCNFHHSYREHVYYGGIVGETVVTNSRFWGATGSGHPFKDKSLRFFMSGCTISNAGPDGEILPPDDHPYSKGGPTLGMTPLDHVSYSNAVVVDNTIHFVKHALSGDRAINFQKRHHKASGHPNPPYYPTPPDWQPDGGPYTLCGSGGYWDPEFWAQVRRGGLGLDGVERGSPYLSVQFLAGNRFVAHNPNDREPGAGVDNWGTYPGGPQAVSGKLADPYPVPLGWAERSMTVLYEGDDARWANKWEGDWAAKSRTSTVARYLPFNNSVRNHEVTFGPLPTWFRVSP